MKWTN